MRISTRPVEASDREFLLALFAGARPELALLPAGFVEMQYAAQQQHYRGAEFSVVLVDGVRAGRLCVLRTDDELRVLDITVDVAFRGRGVGTALLSSLLAEGRDVSLHVALGNPARRLYERLGFEAVAEHGPDVLMTWTPRTEVDACASTSSMPS